MLRPGDVLNLVLCAAILLLNLFFSFSFSAACGEEQRKDPASSWWPNSSLVLRLWTVSWLLWGLLYVFRILTSLSGMSDAEVNPGLMWFSDLNSVCHFLMFLGLSRGNALDNASYKRIATILVVAVTLVDATIVGTGCLVTQGKQPDFFLRGWSLSLAMFATFTLGRAFRLRYHTNGVWILAIFYALAQPFAYAAAFEAEKSAPISIIASQAVDIPKNLEPFIKGQTGAQGETIYVIDPSPPQVKHGMSAWNARSLLSLLWPQIDAAGFMRVFVQLHFRNMVFAFLAAMKLALSATVLATLRSKPQSLETMIRIAEPPLSGSSLTRPRVWKIYYYIHILCIPLVFATCTILFGREVLVFLFLAAVAIGRTLWKTKQGKPYWFSDIEKAQTLVSGPREGI